MASACPRSLAMSSVNYDSMAAGLSSVLRKSMASSLVMASMVEILAL